MHLVLIVEHAIDVLGEGYVEGSIGLDGRYQDILAVADALHLAIGENVFVHEVTAGMMA